MRANLSKLAVFCVCLIGPVALVVHRFSVPELTMFPKLRADAGASARRQRTGRQAADLETPLWHSEQSLYEPAVGAETACGASQLAIVIVSNVGNFDRRHAIRSTWLSWKNSTTQPASHIFLLGLSRQATVNEEVRAESRRFGDLVQGSFMDDYNNLTIKSIYMLRWFRHHCGGARYLLKVDDDVFLNLPFLSALLASSAGRILKATIIGRILLGSRPVRNPSAKWFAGDGFAGSEYPPYASGPLYVITADVVGELLEKALSLPFLRIEDVFITGLCAAASSKPVTHLHHPAITDLRLPPSGCHFRNTVNGHNYTSQEIVRIWTDLNNASIEC